MDRRIEEFALSLKNDSRDQHAFQQLSDELVRKRRWQDLIDLVQRLEGGQGGIEADLHAFLASRLRRMGELTEDLDEKARIFVALATVYEVQLDQFEAAQEAFARVLRMNSLHPAAVEGRARVLRSAGRTNEALVGLRAAAEATDDSAWSRDLLFEIARISEELGEKDAAADARTRAMAIDARLDAAPAPSVQPEVAQEPPPVRRSGPVAVVVKDAAPPVRRPVSGAQSVMESAGDAPPVRRPVSGAQSVMESAGAAPPVRRPVRGASGALDAPGGAPPVRRAAAGAKVAADAGHAASRPPAAAARPKRSTPPMGAAVPSPDIPPDATAEVFAAAWPDAGDGQRSSVMGGASTVAVDAVTPQALSGWSAHMLAREVARMDSSDPTLPALLAEANRRALSHPAIAGAAMAYARRPGATGEERLLAASLLVWADRIDEAVEALPPANDVDPEVAADVLRFLRKRAGKPTAGEPWFKVLRRRSPRHEECLRFQVHGWREAKDHRRLAVGLQSLRELLPKSEEWVTLGEELATLVEEVLESPDRAIELWQEIHAAGERVETSRAEISRLLRAMGRTSALAEHLRRALAADVQGSADTERIERFEELASLYRDELGETQLAIETWETLLKEVPGHHAARTALADALAASGRAREATEHYRELAASASDPRHRALWLARAGMAAAGVGGLEKEAATLLEESLVLHPSEASEERATHRKRLTELWESTRIPHRELRVARLDAMALAQSERLEKLASLARQAAETCPGTTLHGALLEDWLRLDPNNDEAWAEATGVVDRLGDDTASVRLLRLRATARPEDTALEQALIGRLLERPADWQEAASRLMNMLTKRPDAAAWSLLLGCPQAMPAQPERFATVFRHKRGATTLRDALRDASASAPGDAASHALMLRTLLQAEGAPEDVLLLALEGVADLEFDEGHKLLPVHTEAGALDEAFALWSELRGRFPDQKEALDRALVTLATVAAETHGEPERAWPALVMVLGEASNPLPALLERLRVSAIALGEERRALQLLESLWSRTLEEAVLAVLGREGLSLAARCLPADHAQVITWLERRLRGLASAPLRPVEEELLDARGHVAALTRLVEVTLGDSAQPLPDRLRRAERWIASPAAASMRLDKRLAFLEPLGPPDQWSVGLQAAVLPSAVEARRHDLVFVLGGGLLERAPSHEAARLALPALLLSARLQKVEAAKVRGWVTLETRARGRSAIHRCAEALLAYIEASQENAEPWRDIVEALAEAELPPAAERARLRLLWRLAKNDADRARVARQMASLSTDAPAEAEQALDMLMACWPTLALDAEVQRQARVLATGTSRLAGLAARTESEAEARTDDEAAELFLFAASLHASRAESAGEGDALDALRQAVTVAPGHVEALRRLAHHLEERGDHAAAADAMQRLAALGTSSAEVVERLVHALELMQRTAESLDLLVEQLEAALDDHNALDALAAAALEALVQAGHAECAWNVVERLRMVDGDTIERPPWPLRRAAWAAAAFGEGSQQHLERLEAAWRAEPDKVALHQALVDEVRRTGDKDKLLRVLHDGLRLLQGAPRLDVLAMLCEDELAASGPQAATLRALEEAGSTGDCPPQLSPALLQRVGEAVTEVRWIEALASMLEQGTRWREATALRIRAAEQKPGDVDAWKRADAAMRRSGEESSRRWVPALRAALLQRDATAALGRLEEEARREDTLASLREEARALALGGEMDDAQGVALMLLVVRCALGHPPGSPLGEGLWDDLAEAEALDPADPRVHALAAEAGKAEGRWKEVVSALQRQADTEPDGEARFALLREQGLLRWRMLDDIGGAHRVLDRALLLQPTDVETLELVAKLHVERQDWQGALAILRRVGRHGDETAASRALIQAALLLRDECNDPEGCVQLLLESLAEKASSVLLLEEASHCLEGIAETSASEVQPEVAWKLAAALGEATEAWSPKARAQLLRWRALAGEADASAWQEIATMASSTGGADELTWLALCRGLESASGVEDVLARMRVWADAAEAWERVARHLQETAHGLAAEARPRVLATAARLLLQSGEAETALQVASQAHLLAAADPEVLDAWREVALAADAHEVLSTGLERSSEVASDAQSRAALLAEAGRLRLLVLNDAERGIELLARAATLAPLTVSDTSLLVHTLESREAWDMLVDVLRAVGGHATGEEAVDAHATAARVLVEELLRPADAVAELELAVEAATADEHLRSVQPVLESLLDVNDDDVALDRTHLLVALWPRILGLESGHLEGLARWARRIARALPIAESSRLWETLLEQARWTSEERWTLRGDWLVMAEPMVPALNSARDAAIEEGGAWEPLRRAIGRARSAATTAARRAALALAEAEVALLQQDLPDVAHTLALIALREAPESPEAVALLRTIQDRTGSASGSRQQLRVELALASTDDEKLAWAARLARAELVESRDGAAAISALWSTALPSDRLHAVYLEIVRELKRPGEAALRASLHEAASHVLHAPERLEALRAAAREHEHHLREPHDAWRLWQALQQERADDEEAFQGAVRCGIRSGHRADALRLLDASARRGIAQDARAALEVEVVELLLREGQDEDVEEAVRRLGMMVREGLQGMTARRRLRELLSEPAASHLAAEALLERAELDGTREERIAVYEVLLGHATSPNEEARWHVALGEEWLREPAALEDAWPQLMAAHRLAPARGRVLESIIELAVWLGREETLAAHLEQAAWPQGSRAPGALIARLERMSGGPLDARRSQAQGLRDSAPQDAPARVLWLAVLSQTNEQRLWLSEARDALARGLLQRTDVWRWRIARNASELGESRAALQHALALADEGLGPESIAAMELILRMARTERGPNELAALHQVLQRASQLSLWTVVLRALETRLVVTDKPADRLALYHEVAQLRVVRMGDADGAFDALCAALSDITDHPPLVDKLVGMVDGDTSRAMRLSSLLGDLAEQSASLPATRSLRLRAAELADTVMEDPELALDHLEAILAADPTDVDVAQRALALLDRLDLPEAQVRWLEKLLEHATTPSLDAARARRLAVLAEERLGQPELAIKALRRLEERGLASDDDRGELQRLVEEERASGSKPAVAATDAERSSAPAPAADGSLPDRIRAALAASSPEAALALARAADAGVPAQERLEAAMLLESFPDAAEVVVSLYRALLADAAEGASAAEALARVYRETEQVAELAAWLQERWRADHEVHVAVELAELLADELDQAGEAAALLDDVLRLHPENWDVRMLLSSLHQGTKDLEAAEDVLLDGVAYDANPARVSSAWLEIARIRERGQQDATEILAALHQALQEDPENARAKDFRRRVEESRGAAP